MIINLVYIDSFRTLLVKYNQVNHKDEDDDGDDSSGCGGC